MLKRMMKRWTSLALAIALTLTLLPIIPGKASAAAGQPSFFYPDDNSLSVKANLDDSGGLSKSIAYQSATKLLTIAGTYNSVSSDSLKVKVEQMVNIGGTNWQPDSTRTYTKAVTAIGSRFEALNLQLYTGYNKITLSGTLNGTEKSDIFYVLYEDVPYLQSLQVGAGSNQPFDLNAGAARVVKKPATTSPNYKMMVYIQGDAINATKVVINGNLVSPTSNGQFFAPPIQLNPGKNDINITLSNDTNTVEETRTLFYYDDAQPFVDISLVNADGTNSVLNGTPVLTANAPEATLNVKMLVPYQSTPFDNVSASVYTDVYTSNTQLLVNNASVNETIIYGTNGLPEFKYVTFTAGDIAANPYTLTSSTVATPVLNFDVQVTYGSGPTQFTGYNSKLYYKFYPGSIKINNIKLLKDYNVTTSTYSSKVDLDKSEVSDSDFYIEVAADKDTSAATLDAKLLPYSTTTLTVDLEPGTAVFDAPNNQWLAVYHVQNLPSGAQQIQFIYNGSPFVATVSYISKSHISVDNLYNDQVITVDSSSPIPAQIINGSFVNFNNMSNPQVSVNGISLPGVITPGSGYYTITGQTFQISVPFSGTGSFFFGENHLVIKAKETIGSTVQYIQKDIRVYIVDKNEPKVVNFKPLETPKVFPTLDDTVFAAPLKQIRFATDKYVTKLKVIDIGIQGSGADTVSVFKGGDLQVEIKPGTIPLVPATVDPITNKIGYQIDSTSFDGDSKDFKIRLKNIQVPETGSHVFTVEFRNSTGARVTQRLEIMREVADIVVWSPVATVGERIVVNKNFVLFDVEAESAETVTIDGKAATPRSDLPNRYTYNYIGLKPDKEQSIKITVTTAGVTKTQTVKVLYTGPVEPGAQYMEKLSSKHNLFNGGLNLTFPKGTVLKTANPDLTLGKAPKFYDRQNLFFGIATPQDGVVERVNDYGQIKGSQADSRTWMEQSSIIIDPWLSDHFTNSSNRDKFTTISPVYWISGGLGESKGLGLDKAPIDGQDPYSVEGTFSKYPAERKIVPTNRGELTLKFNGGVVDAAGTIVTVFYFNDQGEWTNLGGVVDTKKNTITVPFNDFGYYLVGKLKEGYSDVTNHPWARNVLEALYAKGFMENARYDEFGTDDYITRGEFTTLLVRALNIPLNYDDNNTFFDVFPGANALWKYEEIETAARAGIITGFDNRYFGVNQRITREDAATMIQRASDLKTQTNDSKLSAALQKDFTDGGNISFYALPAVQAVNKDGIMVGLPNELIAGQKKPTVRFDPKANMTRAQAGAIVVRLLQKKTDIFPKNFN